MRGEFVDLGGARLYYYAAGTRGAGEPIVLLHGFPTSSHVWKKLVPLLPAGHRVVVLDLLGFGRSDRPGAHDITLGAHASRVVALLDELKIEQACIVGHDIGGGIAQILAVRHPARVSRLCLVDSVAFDDWPCAPVKFGRLVAPASPLLPPATVLAITRREMMRGYVDQDRGLRSVDRYLRPFEGAAGRNALIAHLRALHARETMAIAPSLGSIAVPTAVVWGAGDPFLPLASGERLARTIPRATLDVLPRARHFTPEEAPSSLASIIARLMTT